MHIYSQVRPVSIHMLFRNKDEISQTKEEPLFLLLLYISHYLLSC